MEGQELLETKTHQIWLKDDGDEYLPWKPYVYLDWEYQFAVNMASNLTGKGYDVKLVTSIVTYVI